LATVTSLPAGISCGATCSAVLDDGTTVSLKATPAMGYRVAEWSGCDATEGNTCQVTMDTDSTVAADIEPIGPPETWISGVRITKHGRSATLSFGGGQGTGTLSYSCRIDNHAFTPCAGQAKYSIRGKHTFQAVATDELGRSDPTPASRGFRLARRR
jgi:List-Bact-rpt repeat protein